MKSHPQSLWDGARFSAGAWLDAIPVSSKFALKPGNFCLATRMRLGCAMPLHSVTKSCCIYFDVQQSETPCNRHTSSKWLIMLGPGAGERDKDVTATGSIFHPLVCKSLGLWSLHSLQVLKTILHYDCPSFTPAGNLMKIRLFS